MRRDTSLKTCSRTASCYLFRAIDSCPKPMPMRRNQCARRGRVLQRPARRAYPWAIERIPAPPNFCQRCDRSPPVSRETLLRELGTDRTCRMVLERSALGGPTASRAAFDAVQPRMDASRCRERPSWRRWGERFAGVLSRRRRVDGSVICRTSRRTGWDGGGWAGGQGGNGAEFPFFKLPLPRIHVQLSITTSFLDHLPVRQAKGSARNLGPYSIPSLGDSVMIDYGVDRPASRYAGLRSRFHVPSVQHGCAAMLKPMIDIPLASLRCPRKALPRRPETADTVAGGVAPWAKRTKSRPSWCPMSSAIRGSPEPTKIASWRGREALRSDLIDPTIAVHLGRIVKRTGDDGIVEFRECRRRGELGH